MYRLHSVKCGKDDTMTAAETSDAATKEVVVRFMDSLNRQDLDKLMADMTGDCVFEHVAPADKGFGRHEGHDAVRAVWAGLPGVFPNYHFEIDDVFASDNRCTLLWTITFDHPEAGKSQARGVDIYRLQDGKIAEKLSYLTL
jgi:ketosteroid isomerase-like protein